MKHDDTVLSPPHTYTPPRKHTKHHRHKGKTQDLLKGWTRTTPLSPLRIITYTGPSSLLEGVVVPLGGRLQLPTPLHSGTSQPTWISPACLVWPQTLAHHLSNNKSNNNIRRCIRRNTYVNITLYLSVSTAFVLWRKLRKRKIIIQHRCISTCFTIQYLRWDTNVTRNGRVKTGKYSQKRSTWTLGKHLCAGTTLSHFSFGFLRTDTFIYLFCFSRHILPNEDSKW